MKVLKEERIRPQRIFNSYLNLSIKDTNFFFRKKKKIVFKCPACNKQGKKIFSKLNFDYDICNKCNSIYHSPRYKEENFKLFYKNGKSVKYWGSDFYKQTSKSRVKLLWIPKIKLIKKIINTKKVKINHLIDIGSGFGDFLNLAKKKICSNTTGIEPSKIFNKIYLKNKHSIINKNIEDINTKDLPNNNSKLFTSFELFEHVYDPNKFVKKIYEIMKKGDILILSTLSGTGLDISTLGQNSKSINPPHHINFLNPYSMKILFNKHKFKVLDLFTPGKLDIDIMQNNVDKIEDLFWKNFILKSTKEEKNKMQKFLQNNNLSSHMWIVCQK